MSRLCQGSPRHTPLLSPGHHWASALGPRLDPGPLTSEAWVWPSCVPRTLLAPGPQFLRQPRSPGWPGPLHPAQAPPSFFQPGLGRGQSHLSDGHDAHISEVHVKMLSSAGKETRSHTLKWSRRGRAEGGASPPSPLPPTSPRQGHEVPGALCALAAVPGGGWAIWISSRCFCGKQLSPEPSHGNRGEPGEPRRVSEATLSLSSSLLEISAASCP